MRRFATIKEIAVAVGKHETTIRRKLDRFGSTFVWGCSSGGSEKRYLTSMLPKDYRVAIAAMDAVPVSSDPVSFEERVGATAAQQILADNAAKIERERIAKEEGLAAFEKLPKQRKAEAEARYAFMLVCDGFVKAAGFEIRRYARRSKVGDQAFVKAYNSGQISVEKNIADIIGNKTSYSTIKRICDNYYKYGIAGLAFGYHNPKRGSTALTDEQQDCVIGVMCQNPQTSSKNIQRALQGKFGMDVPSTGVITRFRNRWVKENQDLWLYFTNPDEWKNSKAFSFGSASENIDRLNQLWEADSTPADLMLVDGRYSLIGMIDVYSRRLRYLVSKTSRASSVVALIRHCLIDWGVPEKIKTDNGKDYVSNHVVQVMNGLKIEQILCTPFQGQEKPHIERSFRTFLHGLVELMPGYIGHNIPERKAIEARRSFADRVMDKNSDPVEVNMTSQDLQKFCDEWINFVYQHDAHSGLDGKKPIDMVRNWKQPVRRINNMRALDMLLLETASRKGQRTITSDGISVDNRMYQSREFAGHMGEKVYVLLDPADLGTIYVYLENEHGERKFLCPAIDPVWAGVDRAAFSTSARKYQAKFMREGRAELKRISKEQASHHAYEDYMNLRKSQVDNVIEFPNLGQDYDTPALREAAKAADAIDNLRKEEAVDDDMVLEMPMEEPIEVPKKEKVVVLRSEADVYTDLRSQIKLENRKLTKREYDWLTNFYQNSHSGKGYLSLEGDLRIKIGLEEEFQAKG